jgi:hypothetical protein
LRLGSIRSDNRRPGSGGHLDRAVPHGTDAQYRFALIQGASQRKWEHKRAHRLGALRCISKHEGHTVPVLILRDARRFFRLCGSVCACALLRMRTSIAFQPISRCQTAHLVPAAHFCARGLQPLLRSPRVEGWAERRELSSTDTLRSQYVQSNCSHVVVNRELRRKRREELQLKTLIAPSTAARRNSSVSACWFLAATIL